MFGIWEGQRPLTGCRFRGENSCSKEKSSLGTTTGQGINDNGVKKPDSETAETFYFRYFFQNKY